MFSRDCFNRTYRLSAGIASSGRRQGGLQFRRLAKACGCDMRPPSQLMRPHKARGLMTHSAKVLLVWIGWAILGAASCGRSSVVYRGAPSWSARAVAMTDQGKCAEALKILEGVSQSNRSSLWYMLSAEADLACLSKTRRIDYRDAALAIAQEGEKKFPNDPAIKPWSESVRDLVSQYDQYGPMPPQ